MDLISILGDVGSPVASPFSKHRQLLQSSSTDGKDEIEFEPCLRLGLLTI